MSWGAAADVLYAEDPTVVQIDALCYFALKHSEELAKCYEPKYAHQRPVVCRFLARLFVLLETEDWEDTKNAVALREAVEKIADSLARVDTFKGIFHHALTEGDVPLLELVHSSLFTQIVFDSALTGLWFEEKRKAEPKLTEFSDLARALITIISVQFIDVRQNWSALNPSSELITKLNAEISASHDYTVVFVWNLALYFMAQSYYASEQGDETHGIESLMQSMQARAGVHWSEVLRDQLQMLAPNVEELVRALEVVQVHKLGFLNGQLLSQTVADVISCLFVVSKPSETLWRALSIAVSPWEALQDVEWVVPKCVALTKAKNPASVAAVVSIAQTMNLKTRYEFLRDMTSYVNSVDAESLDIDEELVQQGNFDHLLGTDMRTSQVVSVLPARITDHEGSLELDAGTRGTLLAYNGTECLMMWYFTYNGWSLLGRLLENADLIEGDAWSPLTIEIFRLVIMSLPSGIQTVLSAGLARGDIVDLLANRMQSWIHNGHTGLITLAFDFLKALAKLDPPRVWALMSTITWSKDSQVLSGAKELLMSLWSTFDRERRFHIEIVHKILSNCTEQFLSVRNFDSSILPLIQKLLPVDHELQEDILGTTPLRESNLAALLANLETINSIVFCTYCVDLLNASERKELSYLEKSLFERAQELYAIFRSRSDLRLPIIRLWSSLMTYVEAPPLLAFLDNVQGEGLKKHLAELVTDKLQPDETLNTVSHFIVSARRQESLVDLLKSALVPLVEQRLRETENPDPKQNIMESLLISDVKLAPATIDHLVHLAEAEIDNGDCASLQVKSAAIRLLTQQLVPNKTHMASLMDVIGKLTPMLAKVDAIRPNLHSTLYRNLKSKWPTLALAHGGDTTATFDPDLKAWDAELGADPEWKKGLRPEMAEAVDNKLLIGQQSEVVVAWCDFMQAVARQYTTAKAHIITWSESLLAQNSLVQPVNLQVAEDKRTSTAMVLLAQHSEASVELLSQIYHQVSDITVSPYAGLPSLRRRLLMLMRMSVLVLGKFEENSAPSTKLTPILLGLLDVVVIKQLQIFEGAPDTVKLQLLILRQSLRLLRDPAAPRSLVQSMTESGSDVIILRSFMATPVSAPTQGEVLMLYIQEWLPTEIMTDNFVRNGLMNVLIESPLGRAIQEGDIIAGRDVQLHSLWRQGILTVVLRLLNQLGSRISQESWLFISLYASQIATCHDQWKNGQISLGLVEETMLIYAIFRRLDEVDTNKNDKADVAFEVDDLVKCIDLLLSHQKYLIARKSKNDELETVNTALRDLKELIST